ncbi:uncharacterized protein MAM_01093 [Metarhizium album ARSEF 1941]|uniref:Uncharacterized protein n=1 Tax=Metarhizium album (strain ARSEF 1941) TaxID=1081103 RepID=A0A0B2X0M7_METAS|nr:uncharacterized protein MAM_01093 [Metarhizium album ARSEF 1941]KHO02092.1 hypothetical protein MAM_01093 [Metarhizium album ARSEF 1941]
MRLSWGLVLGLAFGAGASRLAPRQNDATPTGSPRPPPTATSTSGDNETSSTSSSSSSSSKESSDSTVFVTTTVTSSGAGSIVSETTTVTSSSVATVTVTTTDIPTTTITMSDGDTSTKTVFVTSTQTVNLKRSVDGVLRHIGEGPALVDAQPTTAPSGSATQAAYLGAERIRLGKRAVVTSTVTVTVGGGGGATTTVVQTVTKNVRSTTTSLVHVTSWITETYQANAKTTVTITSTIVTKLTLVSTGMATSTSIPTGSPNPANSNSDSDGSGLPTAAKAGIGVGAGVAGLAIVGALLWFCTRRRRGPKPDPDDLLGPSSEVPVGAGGSRPMSQRLTSAPGSAPHRSPILPNVQPEGYRGTAMGDGRAGYAKPEPYGAAYAPARSATNSSYPSRNGNLSPGDQLPRHPTPDTTTAASVSPLSARAQNAELSNDGPGARWHTSEAAEMATGNAAAGKWHSDSAHEIDSHPVMGHQSGPVYEMPTEHFK